MPPQIDTSTIKRRGRALVDYALSLEPAAGGGAARGAGDSGSPSGRERAGTDTPFRRLALVHLLGSAADAFMPVALAGSLFFSIPTAQAKGRVALALALTVAPFAIVGPLLGPIIDRVGGGRRSMVVVSAVVRAIAVLFMAKYIHGLLLFPAALVALVGQKTYTVVKSAFIPAVVDRPQQLVRANSKLAVGASVVGLLAAGPAILILKVFNASVVLYVDVFIYAGVAYLGTRLPGAPTQTSPPASRAGSPASRAPDSIFSPVSRAPGSASSPASRAPAFSRPGLAEVERADGPANYKGDRANYRGAQKSGIKGLPPGGMSLAWTATGSLRLLVGLLTFLVVFDFRRLGAPVVWYGLAGLITVLGNVGGAVIAPRVRHLIGEETMLWAANLTVGIAAIVGSELSIDHMYPGALIIAGALGVSSNSAKLAFDAIVQRDIPPAGRGKLFARSESGFQLVWVFGALIPVLIPIGLRWGIFVIFAISLGALVLFLVGMRAAERNALPQWWPGESARRHRPDTPDSRGDGPDVRADERVGAGRTPRKQRPPRPQAGGVPPRPKARPPGRVGTRDGSDEEPPLSPIWPLEDPGAKDEVDVIWPLEDPGRRV